MIIQQALAAIVLASLAGESFGQQYGAAYDKHSKCESAGELAKSFVGLSTKELRAAAAEVDDKVKKKEMSKTLGEETKYVFFLGKTARSEKDAYLSAWSWCMDQKK